MDGAMVAWALGLVACVGAAWSCASSTVAGPAPAARPPVQPAAAIDGPPPLPTCSGPAPALTGPAESPRPIIQGRHTGSVEAVRFARNGRLATLGADGSVRIWDVPSRLQLSAIRRAELGAAQRIAWNEAGDRLAVAFATQTLVFDPAGDELGEISYLRDSSPEDAAWRTRLGQIEAPPGVGATLGPWLSADGSTAAQAQGQTLVVWKIEAPASTRRDVTLSQPVHLAALFPRGDCVLVATLDFSQGTSPPPAAYAVLDTAQPAAAPVALPGTDAFPQALTVSPDGAYAAAATQTELVVWRLPGGELAFRQRSPLAGQAFRAVDVSHDGRWLAAGLLDGTVLAYELGSGRLHGELGAAPQLPATLHFTTDDRLAVGSAGRVTLWSLETGTVVQTHRDPKLVLVGVDAAGSVVVGTRHGSTSSCPTGQELLLEPALDGRTLAPAPGIQPAAHCLSGLNLELVGFDAVSSRLVLSALQASGSLGLAAWNLDTGASVALAGLDGWSGLLEAAAVEGKWLVAKPHLGRAVLWDLDSGERVGEYGVADLAQPLCAGTAAMAADGSLVAVSCGARVTVRELPSGAVRFTYDAGSSEWQRDRRISALRFGQRPGELYLGLVDGSVALLRDGSLAATGTSDGGMITGLGLERGGSRLASASADGGVRIWALPALAVLATLVEFADGEQVAFTPAGAYAGTPEVAERIGWMFPAPLELFRFEQFASSYARPAVVARRLAGELTDLEPVARRPPRVSIAPSRSPAAEPGAARFRIAAASPGRVDAVRLFVEGRLVAQQAVCQPRAEIEIAAPLLAGTNRVTALAFDERGAASNPAQLDRDAGSRGSRPDLWVVAVGVSRYPGLPAEFQLVAAALDARGLAAALAAQAGPTGLYRSAHVTELVDEQATPAAIEAALRALSAMKPDDVAVVSMAGHGVKPAPDADMVFLTGGAKLGSSGRLARAEAETHGVGYRAMATELAAAKGRVLLLLDACHAGHVSRELVVPNDELAGRLSRSGRAGVVVFAAAKGRQLSYEDGAASRGLVLAERSFGEVGGGTGHGFFTGAILQSLADRGTDHDHDGTIQLSELLDEVTGRVTRATGSAQTPWVARREIFGDFALARSPTSP